MTNNIVKISASGTGVEPLTIEIEAHLVAKKLGHLLPAYTKAEIITDDQVFYFRRHTQENEMVVNYEAQWLPQDLWLKLMVLAKDNPRTIVPLTNSILDRLNELAKLKADWDSYGAQPISNTALVYALGILQITKGNFSQKEELEPFFIAPIADGGLQIEWRRQGHELEIEITSEGVLGYLLKIKQEEAQTIEEKSEISLDVVLNVVAQFLNLD